MGTVAHAKNLTGLAQRGYEHLQRDSKLKKKELSVMKERNYITRVGSIYVYGIVVVPVILTNLLNEIPG